jgi:heme exporter protein D
MFQFENFSDFIYMAGHGQYVWTAYSVSLIIMAYIFVMPLLRKKNIIQKIQKKIIKKSFLL